MSVTVRYEACPPGEVSLDDPSFGTESTPDDTKLDAALSYIAPLTYKPGLRFSNRLHYFQKTRPGLHGLQIRGIGRGQLGGVSSSHGPGNLHTSVHLEMTPQAGEPFGVWWDCSDGVIWDMYLGGMSIYSNNGVTQFIRGAYPGGGIRECTFADITTQNLYGTLGNSSEALAATICNFTGGWQIIEPRNCGVHIGGSDNRVIFDQGIDFFASGYFGNAGEKFMMILDALGRSNVGPIYITASGGWRGLLIKGNKNAPGLSVTGAVIEGNGTGGPVDGSLVRVEGGVVTFRDCTIGYGMANPSLTKDANSSNVADRGLIEILGSDTQVLMDGISLCLANTPNTTPAVVATGSPNVRLRNFMRGQGGGTQWGSQLPIFQHDSTSVVSADDTLAVQAI